MKLFTKSIDKKLFAQYDKGSDLKNQKVIAKIFNPYGRGTWYILNSDPEDPDYLWAITDLFEIEIGSVSRNELENIKVPPFRLPLERDMYFDEINAYELYQGLKEGKRYDDGGYMAKGGILKVDDYVWNAVGNKLIVDKVTDDEYFLIGFGQSSPSPFSKQKVDNYIETGEWTLKPKMANSGYMAEGGFVVYDKNFDENGKMKITIIGKHKTRLAAKKSAYGTGYNITDMETFEEMYGDKMNNGGFLKDAKYVSKRNISSITLELDGKSVTLKGEDLVDGVYVKKTKSATKTPTKTKVDVKEVANKLSDLYYDVWDKLKIESGSQIYSSDATQKKLNKELKNIGIDEIYSKLTKPERKKVSDILTDENQHSLRNYLGLRGYNGEQEYNSYVTMYEDNMKNYKRAYVLNPKNFDRVLAEGGGLGDSTYLVKVAEEYAEKEYGKKVKKGAGVAKAKKVGDKYDYSEVTVFFQDGTQETFEREDFEEFFEIED